MRAELDQRRALLHWPAITAPLGVISIGAIVSGSGAADVSALFSIAMLACLGAAILRARPGVLRSAMRRNFIAIAAFFVFACWTIISVIPVAIASPQHPLASMVHPAWRDFGLEQGAISLSPYRTVEGLVSFFGPVAAYALGALSLRYRNDRVRLELLLAIATCALSAYALALHLQTMGPDSRLMFLFGSANSAASLFGAMSIFNIATIFRHTLGTGPDKSKGRLAASIMGAPFAWVAAFLSSACLLFTASRAGMLAYLLGLGVLMLLLMRKFWQAKLTSVVVLAPIIALMLFGGHFAMERVEFLGPDSQMRALLSETHWRAFLERPVIGHGLNTFHELSAYYGTPEAWPALRRAGSVHNIYIQALEEAGIVGFLLFAAMLGTGLALNLRIAFSNSSRGSVWAASAFAAFVAVLVHGAFDFGLQSPPIAALLCFVLGVGAAASANGAEKPEDAIE